MGREKYYHTKYYYFLYILMSVLFSLIMTVVAVKSIEPKYMPVLPLSNVEIVVGVELFLMFFSWQISQNMLLVSSTVEVAITNKRVFISRYFSFRPTIIELSNVERVQILNPLLKGQYLEFGMKNTEKTFVLYGCSDFENLKLKIEQALEQSLGCRSSQSKIESLEFFQSASRYLLVSTILLMIVSFFIFHTLNKIFLLY